MLAFIDSPKLKHLFVFLNFIFLSLNTLIHKFSIKHLFSRVTSYCFFSQSSSLASTVFRMMWQLLVYRVQSGVKEKKLFSPECFVQEKDGYVNGFCSVVRRDRNDSGNLFSRWFTGLNNVIFCVL